MTVMDVKPEERKYGDILAERRTELALIRTILAAGRNLMAWTRTSLSLISFGFTVYKLLHSWQVQGTNPAIRASVPRNLGLLLIGLGTFPLIMVIVEYWKSMRQIGQTPTFIAKIPSFVLASAILVLGLFLFVTMLADIELL
jgi:putative membrane protein